MGRGKKERKEYIKRRGRAGSRAMAYREAELDPFIDQLHIDRVQQAGCWQHLAPRTGMDQGMYRSGISSELNIIYYSTFIILIPDRIFVFVHCYNTP